MYMFIYILIQRDRIERQRERAEGKETESQHIESKKVKWNSREERGRLTKKRWGERDTEVS
jgi:hypothetical protein